MTYTETAADHAFTAFLAHLTPGRVLRDRGNNFSKPERKRAIYLREKTTLEQKIARQQAAMTVDNAATVAETRT